MLNPTQFNQLKASGKLPSPRGPALKVMELCQRDRATLPEIIHVLKIDPAMVGRILKLANSAAFGRPRAAVALTSDVLMSVGLQAVRQVVMAFSLVSENRSGRCPGFDYELFWSRSAATGVATQLVGAATRVAPPADLFSVGLLANVGRLALAAVHVERYGMLLAQVDGPFAAALNAMEKAAFGYTHLDMAAALMNDWRVPKMFVDAVSFHEKPELARCDEGSRVARLIHCLHLGARMVGLCFTPPRERVQAFASVLELGRNLGIADDDLTRLGDQMLREWSEWNLLLEIAAPEVAAFSNLATSAQGAVKDISSEMLGSRAA